MRFFRNVITCCDKKRFHDPHGNQKNENRFEWLNAILLGLGEFPVS